VSIVLGVIRGCIWAIITTGHRPDMGFYRNVVLKPGRWFDRTSGQANVRSGQRE